MPDILQGADWKEIRVDIDPGVEPDIVASFSSLHMIRDASVDAVWSSHNIEHMALFEARRALNEASRVLKDDGFLFITLPDVEAIARLITEGRWLDVIYESPAGPITPLDMLFGHQESQEKGHRSMAHRSAFSSRSLARELHSCGFSEVRVIHGPMFDIWGLAGKQVLPAGLVAELHEKRR